MRKKRILFQSDSALAKTGFGRNSKAVLSHLYDTQKYEIFHYCCGTNRADPALKRTPWESLGTMPDNQDLLIKLNKDPQQGRDVNYGGYFVNDAIKQVKPDVFIGVQDIWGVESMVKKPWFKKITSAIWTTLDSLPLYPNAIKMAKDVKNYWVWSNFAEKEFKRLGHDHIKTVHGAISHEQFYNLDPSEKTELRKKFKIEEDAFIIGFVFRNQLRKSVPNLIEGYAKWKSIARPDKNNKKTYLLFHTDWKEGWNIHRLCDEYKVDKSEILTTYICSKCKDFYIKPYKREKLTCELCEQEDAQVTCGVTLGVEESQLNQIYNLMDVYCHPFTSGGQEIPIQEAKFTELVTLATDYSCGEESCEEGSGSIALKWSEYREHGTQFRKASTCPNSIAENLDKVFRMCPEEKEALGKKAREWALSKFSTKVTGKFLEDFIDEAPFSDFNFESLTWKPRNPEADVPDMTDNSKWLIYMYKHILSMDVDPQDEGHKYWMNQISNKISKKNIEEFFRKTARDENQQNIPFKIEDYLDNEGKDKRILLVLPGSIGDVFMATSLLKSIRATYPKSDYNIYFATSPECFEILEGNEHIHKIIPYNPKMDELLWLEGQGKHEGFFSVAYLLHLGTQRTFNYQHNGKDKIALDLVNDKTKHRWKFNENR
jgi:glycosyltransferase involved in cell wall biosynthesis